MRYLTIFLARDFQEISQDDDIITTTAGGSDNAVFPFTQRGLQSLRVYANKFTGLGEYVLSDDAGLFVANAPSPVELPFDMNLNYVDLNGAQKLDHNNLQKAIQIISQYDAGDIINSGNYIDMQMKREVEPYFASSMNHSREQLIRILSSIAVTIGPVVASEKRWRALSVMANQVLITRPTKFKRIPKEQAISIIFDSNTGTFDPYATRDQDQEVIGRIDDENEEDGEFGMGGDWWKHHLEAVNNIADIITEDPDVFC